MNTIARTTSMFGIFLNLGIVIASAQGIAPNQTFHALPTSYLTVTSEPGTTSPASWITVFDATGPDVSRAQPLVSSSTLDFTLDGSGTFGESLGTQGSLIFFPATTNLNPGTEGINTLPANSCVSNVTVPLNQLFTLDVANNAIDVGYSTGTAGAYGIAQNATVPMTPVAMTGSAANSRYAIVSQNVPYGVACNNIATSVTQTGSVTFFETSTDTPDNGTTIPTGRCPVYAVTSPDGRRSFILNRGDDTVTVINLTSAAFDQTVSLVPSGGTHAGPVYAEYVPSRGKLLVTNYDNDTVSIINTQTDSTGADGPAFGQVIATVDLWNGNPHTCVIPGTMGQSAPCSKRPAAISALADGSRAYIAEQGSGMIDILDLRVNQVVQTIGITTGGHPRSVVVVSNASTNSIYSYLFVGTPDSSVIPYTSVEDAVLVEPTCTTASQCTCATGGICAYNGGNISDLRISAQTPTAGAVNSMYTTRLPGAGQPCASPNFAPANLAACFVH
jgi:DNA-binding beta-propeller fold protein YncE